MSSKNFCQESDKETDYRCWQELFGGEWYCILQSLWTSALHKLLPYETLIRVETEGSENNQQSFLLSVQCEEFAVSLCGGNAGGSRVATAGLRCVRQSLREEPCAAWAESAEGRGLLGVEVKKPVKWTSELGQTSPEQASYRCSSGKNQ